MCCAGSPLPKGRLTATTMCKYSTYKGAPNRAGLKGRGARGNCHWRAVMT